MCVATRSSLLHTLTCLIMQTPQSRSKSTRLCLTSSNHSLEPEYHQRITANTSTSWLFTHGKETPMFSTQKFHTYDVNLYRIIIRSALIGWHGNLSLSAKILNDTRQKQRSNVQGTESPANYQEVISWKYIILLLQDVFVLLIANLPQN